MAKASKREWVWMQCGECGDLNYRTTVSVLGGVPKLQRNRYCKRERRHTLHKLKRK